MTERPVQAPRTRAASSVTASSSSNVTSVEVHPTVDTHQADDTVPPRLVASSGGPLIPTVFHQPWWLEAASAGRYQEVEVRSGGKAVARLPYIEERRFHTYRLCIAPELTHFLGPAIDTGPGSPATRSLKHFHLTEEILAQLHSFDGFHQHMHRDVPDTLAFESAGYSTTVKFTHEIPPRPLLETWGALRDKTRNVIRRAQERWAVTELADPLAFSELYNANLGKRGEVNIYTRIPAVCTAAMAKGQGRILSVTEKGLTLGAVFLVWDQTAAYYLLSTRSPEANNGVISLLLWEAIRLATESGLTFDFDGVGTLGSRLFFTGFGGQIKPRYVVYKNRLSLRGLNEIHRRYTRWTARKPKLSVPAQ